VLLPVGRSMLAAAQATARAARTAVVQAYRGTRAAVVWSYRTAVAAALLAWRRVLQPVATRVVLPVLRALAPGEGGIRGWGVVTMVPLAAGV
jgi:hypothetical protein